MYSIREVVSVASSLVYKKGRRTEERQSRSRAGCNRRHSIFLITTFCILTFVILAGISASAKTVTASSSSSGGNSGYQCTFYVRVGIGYGVILSPTGNTSSSSGTDVRFTFTYNDSVSDAASRLSIYSYCDGLCATQLNASATLAIDYCTGNTAYYDVKLGGTDVCRLFVEESAVTPSGDEYRQILACTQDSSGWSSRYYVGQGATVALLTGSSGGSGSTRQSASGWALSPLGNVAVAVAVTISSLIPFFIVLPDAAKTLSDNIVARRGKKGDGRELYISILSVFIPLLCMCVAVLSTTAMLNLLQQPIT